MLCGSLNRVRRSSPQHELKIGTKDKQQRESTTNAINADIQRRARLAGNLAQVTGTMTDSLPNFRMP